MVARRRAPVATNGGELWATSCGGARFAKWQEGEGDGRRIRPSLFAWERGRNPSVGPENGKEEGKGVVVVETWWELAVGGFWCGYWWSDIAGDQGFGRCEEEGVRRGGGDGRREVGAADIDEPVGVEGEVEPRNRREDDGAVADRDGEGCGLLEPLAMPQGG